jgi:hypothetical protein
VPPRKRLTEAEWSLVFDVRCRSKRGEATARREQALVARAYGEDPARYKAMEGDVFDATVPAGSCTKWTR